MPNFAQKSNAKKGGRDSNARRSRSRNTTPGVTRPVEMETPFLEVRMKPFSISSYDEIVEQQSGSAIPDSKSLDALMDRIQNLLKEVEARGSASDRGMRMLAGLRKDRLEEVEAERRDEEQKERLRREAAEEEERGRKANKQKKRKDTSRAREERPLAHGAHGVAPQDGPNLGRLLLLVSRFSSACNVRRNCFGRTAVVDYDSFIHIPCGSTVQSLNVRLTSCETSWRG
jgi:transcriptional adapter 3